MERVDLRRARLSWVEFRGLELENVQLPEDDGHLIVEDYRPTLERCIVRLCGCTDEVSRRLLAALGHQLKWAGQHQRRGVIARGDVRQLGSGALGQLEELLRG
jgi:hypothetical protein